MRSSDVSRPGTPDDRHHAPHGRRAELNTIDTVLFDDRWGGARFVLFEGPIGVGRTALLADAAHTAADKGFLVLVARGQDEYPVARQLSDALAEHRPPISAEPDRAPDSWWRALCSLLRGLSRTRPVLLVVDDAHRVDADSLRWLSSLADRIGGSDVTVLLSAVSGADGALAGLAARATRIVLGGLDERAVTAMASAALASPAPAWLVRSCVELTGGSPLLLGELLRLVAGSPTPDRLTEVASPGLGRSLLARFDADAAGLATVLAVLGSADLAVAGAAAGLDGRRTRAAADLLVRNGFLADGTPAVTPPFAARSILAAIDRTGRDAVHLATARVLAARDLPATDVAAQLVRTGGPVGEPWVATSLRAAAAAAMTRGDTGTVGACVRRLAAEHPRDSDELASLGVMELGLDLSAATEHLSAAVDAARRPAEIGRAGAWLAGALLEAGHATEAVGVLDDALRKLGSDGSETATGLRSFRDCLVAWTYPRLGGDQGWSGPAADAFRASIAGGPVRTTRDLALRAVRELLPVGGYLSEYQLVSDLLCAAAALLHVECHDELAALCDILGARTSRHLLPVARGWVLAVQAMAQAQAGRHHRAIHCARQCLGALGNDARGVLPAVARLAAAVLAECQAELGDVAAAEATVAAFRLDDADSGGWLGCRIRYSHGIVLLAAGQHHAALREFLACGTELADWGAAGPGVLPWRSRAAVAMALLEQRPAGLELVAAEIAAARQAGLPLLLGTALAVRSLLTGVGETDGDVVEARECLRTADSALSYQDNVVSINRPPALTGRHRPAGAGVRLLHGQGRCVLARSLAAMGAADQAIAIHPPADGVLTPHERRLANMAMAGRTNAQIAEHFSVSRRAIEFHFTQIYRKLGIGRRAQLHLALQRREA